MIFLKFSRILLLQFTNIGGFFLSICRMSCYSLYYTALENQETDRAFIMGETASLPPNRYLLTECCFTVDLVIKNHIIANQQALVPLSCVTKLGWEVLRSLKKGGPYPPSFSPFYSLEHQCDGWVTSTILNLEENDYNLGLMERKSGRNLGPAEQEALIQFWSPCP